METTTDNLLEMKKGFWLQINPLRDIEQVKQLVEILNNQGEDFIFSADFKQLMRRKNCLFDNVGEPGYSISKRNIGQGRIAEDLYFNDKLIAIR